MTRGKRAGVLLAVGMTMVSATSLAFAETTSPRTDAGTAELRPVASFAERSGSRLDDRHASLRAAPERADQRRLSKRGVFPIKGSGVDYGEGGAHYGADRGGRMHEGQDLFAPAGTPLHAVRDGRVVETGNDGGRGNYVAIFSPEAAQTYVYLHMQEPSEVSPGSAVKAGQRVGRLGCTGSCFGDHLHFEVRAGRGPEAPPRNPLPLLRRWAG